MIRTFCAWMRASSSTNYIIPHRPGFSDFNSSIPQTNSIHIAGTTTFTNCPVLTNTSSLEIMTTTCQAAATKSLSDHNREYYQYVQYIPWPTPMHQVSSANRGWIDRISANADVLLEQDWVKVLAEQQTRFLRSQADALGLKAPEAGQEFKLLDYACGQGVSSWVCFFSPSKNLFSSQNKKKKKKSKENKKRK